MKEKVFNNTIFILFIILLLIISLNCFLVAFNIIEKGFLVSIVNNSINLIYSNFTNQILLAIVGFFIFFIALYLIWFKQKIVSQIPSVKITSDDGEIKISTASLEQIILNVLNDIKEVKEIKPVIQLQKTGGIRAILSLIVTTDCNIPDTAHFIQQKLREELPRISGVEIKDIKINVNKIDYEKDEANSK